MKNARILCLALVTCLTLSGCGILGMAIQESGDGLKSLCTDAGLDLPDAQILFDADEHGGFHGDGTRFATVRFSESADEELLQSAEGWSPLPVSDAVSALLYEQMTGLYPPGAAFPRPEYGWWYFRDRAADSSQPLGERYSYNFTAAVYDADAGTLYYCEVDT